MRIEVSKKSFFAIFGAFLFIVGLIAVTAFNPSGTGGSPSNVGHSIDEIDWSKTIVANLVVNGNISAKNITSTSLASTGAITGASVCINGDCKSAWPISTSGYQMSCAGGDSGLNFPFCCRIRENDGYTECKVSTINLNSWSNGASPFSATTLGQYTISCIGGNNGGNQAGCCRLNVNTGTTECKRPSVNLNSWSSLADPF